MVLKKRIEEKTSLTAQMTCLIRALSYYEKDALYRSADYIAPLLLPSFLNLLAKFVFFRKIYKHLAPKGIYEYVIARTKYIDEAFEAAADHLEQVLLFGAGFDSRSVRFQNKLKNPTFYELDAPFTQNAKILRLREKKISIPSNVVFIPIDFKKESISKKLDEYGFQKDRVCFFLLEGLTMYLDAKSVDATFNLISDFAGKGSTVVFDYVHTSVIRHGDTYRGEKELSKMVSVFGEKWSFGLERSKICDFLSQYGLFMIDEADSHTLEKRYFTKGKITHHVNETHTVVTAKK